MNYADDLCVLGKAPAVEMLVAVERLVTGLKLAVNERKTRCLRCPEEPMEFLGYQFGWNYRPHGGHAYIGNRPSKASVQSICRKISERTDPRWEQQAPDRLVGELNRMISGWARFRNGAVDVKSTDLHDLPAWHGRSHMKHRRLWQIVSQAQLT